MTATKQTELLPCRNCGGQCDPTGWMCGDGRQGPECEGCGITTPDVDSWNKLMAPSAEPVQADGEAFCDGHCTWLDHQPGCPRAEPVQGEAVATIQWPDIYDERGGLWLSNEDMKRLMALPAGTKLYTSPAKPDAELVELLRDAAELIKRGDFDTGYCCCGGPVDKHGMGDGHSPIDQGGYYAMQTVERIDAKLAELQGV